MGVMMRTVGVWAVAGIVACGFAASGRAQEAGGNGKTVAARIALVGDPHISLEPKHAAYLAHFTRVIADINAAKVDAVLVDGDLTQGGDAASERKFRNMAAGFTAKCWCVAGNHDVGQKPLGDKPATVTEKRLKQFETIVGPIWYAAEIGPGVHLVGITSSLFSSGEVREEAQWEFLKKELTERRPGITILLTHYPPYAVKPDEPRGYFNMEPDSRARLFGLLQVKTGGTKVLLSAHLHRPILHVWGGVTDVGAPAVSFGIPAGKQRVGWTLVTIHRDGQVEAENEYPDLPDQPPAVAEKGGGK